MPTSLDTIRQRVAAVLTRSPFSFVAAVDPDTFDRQPTTSVDGVFLIKGRSGKVQGGMNFSEVRIDTLDVLLARQHQDGDPLVTRRTMLRDVSSIVAAVTRDGATGGGDYAVDDGRTFEMQQPVGAEYAVLRITLPVNYEASL